MFLMAVSAVANAAFSMLLCGASGPPFEAIFVCRATAVAAAATECYWIEIEEIRLSSLLLPSFLPLQWMIWRTIALARGAAAVGYLGSAALSGVPLIKVKWMPEILERRIQWAEQSCKFCSLDNTMYIIHV